MKWIGKHLIPRKHHRIPFVLTVLLWTLCNALWGPISLLFIIPLDVAITAAIDQKYGKESK